MRSRSSARRLALAAACCWRCFWRVLELLLAALFRSRARRGGKRSSYLPRFTLPPPRVYDAASGLLARDVGLLLLRLGLLLSGLLRRAWAGWPCAWEAAAPPGWACLPLLLYWGGPLAACSGLGLRFGYLEQLLPSSRLVPLSRLSKIQRSSGSSRTCIVVLRRGRILRQFSTMVLEARPKSPATSCTLYLSNHSWCSLPGLH